MARHRSCHAAHAASLASWTGSRGVGRVTIDVVARVEPTPQASGAQQGPRESPGGLLLSAGLEREISFTRLIELSSFLVPQPWPHQPHGEVEVLGIAHGPPISGVPLPLPAVGWSVNPPYAKHDPHSIEELATDLVHFHFDHTGGCFPPLARTTFV